MFEDFNCRSFPFPYFKLAYINKVKQIILELKEIFGSLSIKDGMPFNIYITNGNGPVNI